MKIDYKMVIKIFAVLFIILGMLGIVLNTFFDRNFDNIMIGVVLLMGIMLSVISPKLQDE